MRLPVESLLSQRMQPPDMRSVNGIQLLNLIAEAGPISRAALAKLSQLSKPTVSEQVQRLIAHGVVIELGEGASAATGGKRPTLVAFHGDAGRVAGISIAPGKAQIVLCNLSGEQRGATELEVEAFEEPRRLMTRIRRTLEKLLANDDSQTKLRAIGIGVPGRVDCDRGMVLELDNQFRWRDLDLATPMQRRFGCPVLVDNDVNVALRAELKDGAAQAKRTAVLIRVDVGIGAAIAIEGRIHRGSHWAAGEIGHLTTHHAAMDSADPRGNMEVAVASDQVAARVHAAARRIPAVRRHLKTETPIAALFAAANEDEQAASLVEEITYPLCLAVAQHALVFDPDLVLLSGEIFPHVLGEIRRFVARTIPWSPVVELAALGDDAVTIGATDLALGASYEQLAVELQVAPVGLPIASGG